MTNHEPLITDADIRLVDVALRAGTLSEAAADVFAQEPKLAECMSDHWRTIELLFNQFALSPVHQKILRKQITLLSAKPLVLMHRAHRRLWDDVLPATDNESTARETQ